MNEITMRVLMNVDVVQKGGRERTCKELGFGETKSYAAQLRYLENEGYISGCVFAGNVPFIKGSKVTEKGKKELE